MSDTTTPEAPKTEDAPKTAEKDTVLDWYTGITVAEAEQLKAPKTLDDFPSPVVQWVKDGLTSKKVRVVTLPTGAQARVAEKYIRDICYISNPRLTASISKSTTNVIRFSVKPYVAPATPAAAPASSAQAATATK